MKRKNLGLEKIVRDIRSYFLNNELESYSSKPNPKTGVSYGFEARRKFTKYYVENVGDFYEDCFRKNNGGRIYEKV